MPPVIYGPAAPKHIPGVLYGTGVNAGSPQPQRKQTLLIYAWALFTYLFVFHSPGIILILMLHPYHVDILSPPASKNKKSKYFISHFPFPSPPKRFFARAGSPGMARGETNGKRLWAATGVCYGENRAHKCQVSRIAALCWCMNRTNANNSWIRLNYWPELIPGSNSSLIYQSADAICCMELYSESTSKCSRKRE